MKSKRERKNLKMSVKIKKELEKLTKNWLKSISIKKRSKKKVNKFMNNLKKKCKHQS